jgi:hypothetical protein
VLKLPRLIHHAALMRHLRDCLLGKATPAVGAEQGVVLMQMIDAIYKSAASGKSVDVRVGANLVSPSPRGRWGRYAVRPCAWGRRVGTLSPHPLPAGERQHARRQGERRVRDRVQQARCPT